MKKDWSNTYVKTNSVRESEFILQEFIKLGYINSTDLKGNSYTSSSDKRYTFYGVDYDGNIMCHIINSNEEKIKRLISFELFKRELNGIDKGVKKKLIL